MSFELKLSISNKKENESIAFGKTRRDTGEKEFFINLIEDKKETDDLDCGDEIKKSVFKTYLKNDKKLTIKEIKLMVDAYEAGEKEIENDKLSRKYDLACEYVDDSLKKFLNYGENTQLFPVINQTKPFSLYITGMRASGKSYFTREFLRYNKPKDAQIILISPFADDPSLKGLTLVKFDLDEIEAMLERKFTFFDFPEDSIVVFDDIEGFGKAANKRINEIRDACLTVGRHHGKRGLSVISIVHNPLGGNSTKVPLRESSHFVLFPKSNSRDVKVLLKTYGGYSDDKILEVLSAKSRWVFISKTVPSYWVGERQVRLNC
jgi:hypothetical protein